MGKHHALLLGVALASGCSGSDTDTDVDVVVDLCRPVVEDTDVADTDTDVADTDDTDVEDTSGWFTPSTAAFSMFRLTLDGVDRFPDEFVFPNGAISPTPAACISHDGNSAYWAFTLESRLYGILTVTTDGTTGPTFGLANSQVSLWMNPDEGAFTVDGNDWITGGYSVDSAGSAGLSTTVDGRAEGNGHIVLIRATGTATP